MKKNFLRITAGAMSSVQQVYLQKLSQLPSIGTMRQRAQRSGHSGRTTGTITAATMSMFH